MRLVGPIIPAMITTVQADGILLERKGNSHQVLCTDNAGRSRIHLVYFPRMALRFNQADPCFVTADLAQRSKAQASKSLLSIPQQRALLSKPAQVVASS